MPIVNINSKIYPSDYTKDHGTLAIKLPMNSVSDEQGKIFNTSITTEEQSISNYTNLLLTRQGERYMQPNFGVGLMDYIFEPNVQEVKSFLENKIREQSALWLPYIINENIVIHNGENELDGHTLIISITFKVTEQGANRTMKIFSGLGKSIKLDIT